VTGGHPMRGLQRICCAMLVALAGMAAGGCRSMAPGPTFVDIPVEVLIDRDCNFAIPSQKDYVEVDYFTPDSHGHYQTQVKWTLTKDPDDTALLSATTAAYQDPHDYNRGIKIKKLLNAEYYFDRATYSVLS